MLQRSFLFGLVLMGLGLGAGPAQAQAVPGLPLCGSYPQSDPSYACTCAGPVGTGASVWGSGPYTADSNICAAALHAGVIGPEGGPVLAMRLEGIADHPGSERNGVVTRDWGSYGVSMVFDPMGPRQQPAALAPACDRFPANAASLTCACPPALARSGAVWGSGPYTSDSDICTAAQHAGVIGSAGGIVLLMAAPGAQSYAGTLLNGVETRSYGPYGSSYLFSRIKN